MTLKQFIYLIVFLPIAYIIIRAFPIPILNILLGALVGGFGLALAFFPVNDRPLEVFLKNLYKRITSPTQYTYQKKNLPPSFLTELTQAMDPQKAADHLDSKQKLESYLQKNKKVQPQAEDENLLDQRKRSIISILTHPKHKEGNKSDEKTEDNHPSVQLPTVSTKTKPFVMGVVKNNKQMPLPGVLLYIRDEKNNPLRLLKTNPQGVFATYSSLPPGEYKVEIKDPKDTFFFDTMKIQLDKNNPRPLEFYSRELL